MARNFHILVDGANNYDPWTVPTHQALRWALEDGPDCIGLTVVHKLGRLEGRDAARFLADQTPPDVWEDHPEILEQAFGI